MRIDDSNLTIIHLYMKQLAIPIFIILIILNGCSNQSGKHADQPVKIIFDTDMGPDYDDVGALAFLHAMADSGKAEILATIASNKDELVAPSLDVINTYFGRSNLTVGAPKTRGASMTAPQHWPDSIVAKYPHKIRSTSDVSDAVTIYRKILAVQPDSSVTIITVGFLTNLSNLMQSQPDSLSPYNGIELISIKVKRLVSMAGRFPEGREFNVYTDSISSEYVFNEWPGEIIFTGYEIGEKIHTGLLLVNSDIRNSPVKDVYRISIPMSEGDKKGRMSWDETAVLIGVYGTNGFFETNRGNIKVNPDGSNSWENSRAGRHFYVIQKMPVNEMERFIEDRMMHQPVGSSQ
jgi:pyrimidine-specific ribonucleoside hydrolase